MHIAGQAGRDAVDVDFKRVAALGLEEKLVLRLFGEAHDLVLDRGAVARAAGVDLAGVHWRAFEVFANQIVDRLVGVGDVAGELLNVDAVVEIRKRLRVFVARLEFGFAVVDCPTVESRRRAGFETCELDAETGKRAADSLGSAFAGAAAWGFGFARVHESLQKGASGEDDGRCEVNRVASDACADDLHLRLPPSAFHLLCQNIFDDFLA